MFSIVYLCLSRISNVSLLLAYNYRILTARNQSIASSSKILLSLHWGLTLAPFTWIILTSSLRRSSINSTLGFPFELKMASRKQQPVTTDNAMIIPTYAAISDVRMSMQSANVTVNMTTTPQKRHLEAFLLSTLCQSRVKQMYKRWLTFV